MVERTVMADAVLQGTNRRWHERWQHEHGKKRNARALARVVVNTL